MISYSLAEAKLLVDANSGFNVATAHTLALHRAVLERYATKFLYAINSNVAHFLPGFNGPLPFVSLIVLRRRKGQFRFSPSALVDVLRDEDADNAKLTRSMRDACRAHGTEYIWVPESLVASGYLETVDFKYRLKHAIYVPNATILRPFPDVPEGGWKDEDRIQSKRLHTQEV